MSQPVFSLGLEEDTVQRVGTKLCLEVEVEESPEKVFFEWRGPTGSNADDGRVKITESGRSSTAEITPLHLQDQGLWTCSAKNKHGVTQTKCSVLAQVPKSYKAPVFLEELVAGLTEQGTVSLECKVVGIPSPSLRWYKDGEEIRSGDVLALTPNMEKPVSVYRCDAINCMGTVSSTSVLDVSRTLTSQTKSPPVLTETLADKKVKIGELVELGIAVSRACLPVRVVWWNHGQQIAVGEKYSVVEGAEGRYSVIINPVELSDDGDWRVNVENQFGSATSECTLTLRVPKNYRKPRFVENLKAVLTKEGLVSFECKVVGFPTPLLRWFKDGSELKPGDVYQLSGSRSLGTYSCLARNCMGEAASTAVLTVEDIGEKFPDSRSELKFLVPLQDSTIKIGDRHRFSVQVTYSPCLEICWQHENVTQTSGDRLAFSKEDGGFYHCDIIKARPEDEGEWSVVAKDSGHEITSSCSLNVTVPKHYKKPKFLESLRAVLTEEGAVNLECKVIGVPQPTLSWYKDGVELKQGDIHRLMSGKDGSCCLGTYTCVADNCMGSVTSSAALLGFEDTPGEENALATELQTPDISDGNIKPFSLSTIQEERTSQMMSPEAAMSEHTLRQHSLEQDHQEEHSQNSLEKSIISVGKVDVDGEMSLSIGDKEVTLSLYQTPDLSEKDAQNICEMFADQIAESISESKYVELPPLRFTKETAKASNINMEAIVIDIDRQDLEEYESMKAALENVDDLQTECDLVDCSVADWNVDQVGATEFETFVCEEILELDEEKLEEIVPEEQRTVPVPAQSGPSPLETHQVKTGGDSVVLTQSQHQPDEERGGNISDVTSSAKQSINNEAGAGNDQEIKQEEIPQIAGISADTYKQPEKQIELQSEARDLDKIDDVVPFENKQDSKIEEGSISKQQEKTEGQAVDAGNKSEPVEVTKEDKISEILKTKQDEGVEDMKETQGLSKELDEEKVSMKSKDDILTPNVDKSISVEVDAKDPPEKVEGTEKEVSAVTSDQKESTDGHDVVVQLELAEDTKEDQISDLVKREKDQAVADVKESANTITTEQTDSTEHDTVDNIRSIEDKKKDQISDIAKTKPDQRTTEAKDPVENENKQVGVDIDIKETERPEKEINEGTSLSKAIDLSDKNVNKSNDGDTDVKEKSSHKECQESARITNKNLEETVLSKTPVADETAQTKEKDVAEIEKTISDKNYDKSNDGETEVKEKSSHTKSQESSRVANKDLEETIISKSHVVDETAQIKDKDVAERVKTEAPTEDEIIKEKRSDLSEKVINKETSDDVQEISIVNSENCHAKDLSNKVKNSSDDIPDAVKVTTGKISESIKDSSAIRQDDEKKEDAGKSIIEQKQSENIGTESPAGKNDLQTVSIETSKIPDVRQKKQSRQESVVDSESIPDIEDIEMKDNKDLLDHDDLDDEEYFDRMRRERSRSRSSYEETLAGMDPELLKELGIGEAEDGESKTPVPPPGELDLSQIPEETTEERMKRIEEKASGIVIEEDIVPRKSRSRSRSRSKSRPPNLDTVKEQKKEEILEARFYGIQPSLDTIKESPSTASMLGMLQGGMSSASVNTVLQGSQSAASVLKEIPSQPQSPVPKEPTDNTSTKAAVPDKSEPQKKGKKKAQRSDTKSLILEDKTLPGTEEETDELVRSEAENNKVETSQTGDQKIITSETEDQKVITSQTEEQKVIKSEAENQKVVKSESNDKKIVSSETEDNKVETSQTRDRKVITPETKEQKVIKAETEKHTLVKSDSNDQKIVSSEAEDTKVETSQTGDQKVITSDNEEQKVIKSETENQKVVKSESNNQKIVSAEAETSGTGDQKVITSQTEVQKIITSEKEENKVIKSETANQEVVISETKDQKTENQRPIPSRIEDQKVIASQTEEEKVITSQTEDKKVVINKPFVPGYVEREDTTDSEVEKAPESIELDKKEEIKFDKATLIKSINDAANKKIKEKSKEEEKTSEKSASAGKTQTAEERQKLLSDMKEKEAEEIKKVKEEATKKALRDVAQENNSKLSVEDKEKRHPETEKIEKQKQEEQKNKVEADMLEKQKMDDEKNKLEAEKLERIQTEKIKQAEEKRLQEEKIKQEEEEEQRRHIEKVKQDEEQRLQMEKIKKEEEQRLKREKIKQEEEQRLQNEKVKHEEEQKLQEEKMKQEEEQRLKREKIKQEEEQRLQEEKLKQEEEQRLQEEKIKKETEQRLQKEKIKQEEEQRLQKEKVKQEEEQRLQKEKIKQEEEQRLQKEKIKQEEEQKLQKEKIKQEEEQRLQKEKIKQEEEQRLQKEKIKQEEEQTIQNEKQRLQKEKIKQEEEQRLQKETIKQEEEQRLRMEKIKQEELEKQQQDEETKRTLKQKKFIPGHIEKQESLESFEEAEEKLKLAEAAKKLEAERIAKEKVEAEKIAKEKAEAERIAKEKAEAERIAKEKAEAERVAKEKAEAERIAKEKAEAERVAKEKAEAQRITKEKEEAERIAKERAEADRIAKEKAESERIAKEKAEAEWIAKEKAESDAKRLEKKRDEDERIRQERLQTEAMRKTEEERLERKPKEKTSTERMKRVNDGGRKRLDIEPSKMVEEDYKRKSTDNTYEQEIPRRSVSRKSESDRNSGDYSRYKTVISPSLEVPSIKESPRDSNYSDHKTPDLYKYDTISPTFDARSRNISGDYREAVEKSLATSQNLMNLSVVTGTLVQKPEQPKSRPPPSSQSKQAKKAPSDPQREAELRKKLELEKNKVAGPVSDIMIKEVGSNWVSLCWKKPPVSRGSPVITYKVESWLCGEGAFWVELGRTPIPQYDAFNLKADKCYHFRVTARNKSGWGESIMTTHKVDLSRPTQMPVITSAMDPVIKALKSSSIRLSVQVSGEPKPKVSWQKDCCDISTTEGVSTLTDETGHHLDILDVNEESEGKYTVAAANTAGRTTKSVQVQMIDNLEVFEAYKSFSKWQGLLQAAMAPYLVIGPRDRRVEEGTNIQLTCRVVSNPWPVVRWFRNSEQVLQDEYTNIYNEADFQHLQMDDISIDQSGQYSVEAFNEFGSVRSQFTVIVDKGLDRYMPPFFTKELRDVVINAGSNLLLHCRVESYPYIGVSWHRSGAKIRLTEKDFKMIDEDGNVVLVLSDVRESCSVTCTIINEIAENLTSCQVIVNSPDRPLVQLDEDVIRHSIAPRFLSWPENPTLMEGENLRLELNIQNCSSVLLSRDFSPKSVDRSVIQLARSGDIWTTEMTDISCHAAGLHFIIARNSNGEEKYPLVITVRPRLDLSSVTECALDDGVGAPTVKQMGPVFVRDGDTVIIKTSLTSGSAPFSLSWSVRGCPVVWSHRLSPYNRPGCVGIRLERAGREDEGTYSCTITNSQGQATFSSTLLVDSLDPEQKESELVRALCNCPMLDSVTPMMSWRNTPVGGTPRRTPLPSPLGLTPRVTPRPTPRATPRGTPTPSRRSHGPELRSPSRTSNTEESDMMMAPFRRKFIQAPEIFSSFSSKEVEEGETVELKCFISCAPQTVSVWEKDNIPLVSSPGLSLSEKTGVRTLMIQSAKLGDAGVYRLTISNTSGSGSCSAIVTVKKKNLGRTQYYASSQLSIPRSPYSSLGRNSYSRSTNSYSSSSYNSYSSFRTYL